jgi:hypothetical protein
MLWQPTLNFAPFAIIARNLQPIDTLIVQLLTLASCLKRAD